MKEFTWEDGTSVVDVDVPLTVRIQTDDEYTGHATVIVPATEALASRFFTETGRDGVERSYVSYSLPARALAEFGMYSARVRIRAMLAQLGDRLDNLGQRDA